MAQRNNNFDIFLLEDAKMPLEKDVLVKNTQKIFDILTQMPEIKTLSPVFKHNFKHLNFELSFCLDETIRQINRDYRKTDKATDVITFALFVDDESSVITDGTIELGEIIISSDTAKKQADDNGLSLNVEIFTLITHGILHLLGFDHQTQKDYDFIVDIQNRVIAQL